MLDAPGSSKATREKHEPDKIINWLQTCLNSLQVCRCAPDESLHSSSHGAQAVKNQTESLVMRLANL